MLLRTSLCINFLLERIHLCTPPLFFVLAESLPSSAWNNQILILFLQIVLVEHKRAADEADEPAGANQDGHPQRQTATLLHRPFGVGQKTQVSTFYFNLLLYFFIVFYLFFNKKFRFNTDNMASMDLVMRLEFLISMFCISFWKLTLGIGETGSDSNKALLKILNRISKFQHSVLHRFQEMTIKVEKKLCNNNGDRVNLTKDVIK